MFFAFSSATFSFRTSTSLMPVALSLPNVLRINCLQNRHWISQICYCMSYRSTFATNFGRAWGTSRTELATVSLATRTNFSLRDYLLTITIQAFITWSIKFYFNDNIIRRIFFLIIRITSFPIVRGCIIFDFNDYVILRICWWILWVVLLVCFLPSCSTVLWTTVLWITSSYVVIITDENIEGIITFVPETEAVTFLNIEEIQESRPAEIKRNPPMRLKVQADFPSLHPVRVECDCVRQWMPKRSHKSLRKCL